MQNLFYSLHRGVPPAVSLGRSVFGSGVGSGFASEAVEGEHTVTDMSFSTLLLHDVHHWHVSLMRCLKSLHLA